MSDVKAVKRKLRDLVPDQCNANKGTVRGLAMLDDSLREDGAGRGILLDRNNNVVAGNKTLERAVDLGFEEVIIVPTNGKQLVATQRVDVDIDSPQGRRMALRDNRVAEVDLAWDADVLQALAGEGVDLGQFFDDDELAALLADVASDELPDDPGAQVDNGDTLLAKWQVKRGDMFAVGQYRLLCGDSTDAADVARIVPAGAYVLFCDPFFQDHLIDQLNELFSFSNAVFITGGKQMQEILQYSPKFIEGVILHLSSRPQMGNTAIPMMEHKVALWSYTDNLHFGLGESSVIESEMGATRQYGEVYHHTAKPVDVCKRLLSPFQQTVVVDCFAGLGGSLIAAHELGKQWRGIEIEPQFVAGILERAALYGLEVKRA